MTSCNHQCRKCL